MNPVAFHIGPLTIRWYGIMVALGFVTAMLYAQRRARRFSMPPEDVENLALFAVVGGLIGARVLYVISNWSEFRTAPAEIVRIDHGGLVFYGGLIGGGLAAWRLIRRRKLPVWKTADVVAPAVPLGHAIGRIGCLLNGCCFGRPWTRFPCIQYLPGSESHHVQILKGLVSPDGTPLPVFPTQALASLMNLGIFVTLLALEPRLRRQGQLFALYLMLYSGARFFAEFLRGDYLTYIGPFTPAQIICLMVFPASALLFRRLQRKGAPVSAGTARSAT